MPVKAGKLPECRPAAEIDGPGLHLAANPFERSGFLPGENHADPQFLPYPVAEFRKLFVLPKLGLPQGDRIDGHKTPAPPFHPA